MGFLKERAIMSSHNPPPSRVPPKVVLPKPSAPRAAEGASSPEKEPAMKLDYAAANVPGQKPTFEGNVVARGATYYRTTRYIMVVLLLAMGGWFGYDGFKGWPAENERINEVSKK